MPSYEEKKCVILTGLQNLKINKLIRQYMFRSCLHVLVNQLTAPQPNATMPVWWYRCRKEIWLFFFRRVKNT